MSKLSIIPSFETQGLHALDETSELLLGDLQVEISKIKNLANPDECPSEYLPFLAYAFKVDFWSNDLSESEKRALIKSSIALHKYKGTIWSIEKVFEALNIDARVIEWNSYNGEPYHFKVDLSLDDKEITVQRQEQLIKYINIYKNARSHLEEISLSYGVKTTQGYFAGVVGEAKTEAYPIKGYEEIMAELKNISCGAIGETSAYAMMEV